MELWHLTDVGKPAVGAAVLVGSGLQQRTTPASTAVLSNPRSALIMVYSTQSHDAQSWDVSDSCPIPLSAIPRSAMQCQTHHLLLHGVAQRWTLVLIAHVRASYGRDCRPPPPFCEPRSRTSFSPHHPHRAWYKTTDGNTTSQGQSRIWRSAAPDDGVFADSLLHNWSLPGVGGCPLCGSLSRCGTDMYTPPLSRVYSSKTERACRAAKGFDLLKTLPDSRNRRRILICMGW